MLSSILEINFLSDFSIRRILSRVIHILLADLLGSFLNFTVCSDIVQCRLIFSEKYFYFSLFPHFHSPCCASSAVPKSDCLMGTPLIFWGSKPKSWIMCTSQFCPIAIWRYSQVHSELKRLPGTVLLMMFWLHSVFFLGWQLAKNQNPRW